MDLSNKKQVDLLNYLASNIENTVLTLSSLEFQLNKGVAKKEEQDSLVKGSLYGRIDNDDDDIEDDDDDELDLFQDLDMHSIKLKNLIIMATQRRFKQLNHHQKNE